MSSATNTTVIRTLTMHCPGDGTCHCDWRLTLKNCAEGNIMYYINIVNAVLSGLAVVIALGIMYNRIVIKGNALFDFSSKKGCLRPRPVDCLLFFLTIFNILRLLGSIVLVTDVVPDNIIFRSWLFEQSWQFGYGGFALYLVGIAQTLADSHQQISIGWLPSPRLVDIIGCWFFLWPFVINNIFSILAGVYADRDVYIAEICTRLLYVMWFLHNTTLTTAVSFAGYRLIKILNTHLQKFKTSGDRYASVKIGIYRIKMIIVICAVCLLGFASFLFLYGCLRDPIMVNVPGSIFLGVIWTFLGVLTTFFVELVILINPKMEANPAFQMKSSTGGEVTTATGSTTQNRLYGTQCTSSTGGNEKESGNNTMMMMNELHQQQAQYQEVFSQHAHAGPIKHYNNTASPLPPPSVAHSNHFHDSTITATTGASSLHESGDPLSYSPDSDQRHLIDPIIKPMKIQWPDHS
ncbi:hypothetical protein BCR42DRAFT_374720 [Absidia repens]|uniref:Uncharacterized protein n=1 Tax=Absidia repens TaxID=90262 RepID=A0A1X2IGN0_9FUNG|nr:hypothetical protein BCR42DRAFT_374720 [Absidia repens]